MALPEKSSLRSEDNIMKDIVKNAAVYVISLVVIVAVLVGCGTERKDESVQNVPQTTQQASIEDSAPATENAVQVTEEYEDNFAVDSKAAKEFAKKVKEVTARKDLEGLAELTAFPVYVGLPEAGVVKTREDFLNLGADTVFTEALMNSIENADIDHFEPSMAGFSISDGGTSNINFGVVDGVLSISGINY